MEFQRKATIGAVVLSAAFLVSGCSTPGPSVTKTWCDHGNRLYSLDTAETRGETLTVVPESTDCPGNEVPDEIRPEGDTRPLPSPSAVLNGPYRPYSVRESRLAPEAR